MRKPTFSKVADLQPGTKGLNLILKVVSITPAVERVGHDNTLKIVEATVGDETGCVILSARNEQVDLLKQGATIVIRNGRVDLFNKRMRLKVDKWGRLQTLDEGRKATTVQLNDNFVVNSSINVSNKEYKVVIEYV